MTGISNARAPTYDGQYSYRGRSPERAYHPPEPAYQQPESELPDPYLLARYQSPLPLPPGATRPSQSTTAPTPASAPAPARRDPAAEAAEIRRQAVLAEEREAQKRKEQEEADAELARQLDQELNLGDVEEERSLGRSGSAHMPGEW